MTADPDRFRRSAIEVLAKRAANRCSNPECRAITSGPAEDAGYSVNLGEAAHICGARPGAARYDVRMISAERSAITNGIWLCRNCHKVIDADPDQFSTSLLFEWRKEHEEDIAANLGKTSDLLRRKAIESQLEGIAGEFHILPAELSSISPTLGNIVSLLSYFARSSHKSYLAATRSQEAYTPSLLHGCPSRVQSDGSRIASPRFVIS